MDSSKPLGDMETLKLFSEKVGVGNVEWEVRGGGRQIVSGVYQQESEAKRIANVMNTALKNEGEDTGDTIQTVQSRTGGYRVLVDHPSVHTIFFREYLDKLNKQKR